MPADLGPGPDQLNQRFKHTWLFAGSIERVKVAPELVVFLLLWVLHHWLTELARRVVLILVPRIERRTLYLRSHVVQTGGKILFLILLHRTYQAFSTSTHD